VGLANDAKGWSLSHLVHLACDARIRHLALSAGPGDGTDEIQRALDDESVRAAVGCCAPRAGLARPELYRGVRGLGLQARDDLDGLALGPEYAARDPRVRADALAEADLAGAGANRPVDCHDHPALLHLGIVPRARQNPEGRAAAREREGHADRRRSVMNPSAASCKTRQS